MEDRYKDIERRILSACDRAGRSRGEVTLIAVSKTKPASMVEEAYGLGMRHFGENKVQELVNKKQELSDILNRDIHWHLIGHLQRNKVKQVMGKAVLIHSVDSLRLGLSIEDEASKKNILCDILIEVNIAGENTKFGVTPEEVLPLIMELRKLPHIRVRGLMTIAPYAGDSEKNREYFKKLRELFVDIKSKNIDNGIQRNSDQIISIHAENNGFNDSFNILSMGMTGDFEVAIEEGATMIRIGTGIFGERDYTLPDIPG